MTAAVQTVWAELVAASLADAGVADVVVSPGSRSTPIAAALACLSTQAVRVHAIVDERAAAFFALGIARATGSPAAVVCTSGTAPAHYLPAVIEASMSGLPLVIVSADRPPELQGAGASQTIDQTKLFGGFVRRFDDLGAPEASALALRAVRRKIGQAVAASRGPAPGPVHINVPLRKPLEPTAPSTDAERAAAAEAGRLRTMPIAACAPSVRVPDDAVARVAAAIASTTRGVLLATAGPASRRGARDAAFALAMRAGWPVLAEAGSQLKFAPRDGVTVIDHAGLAATAELPSYSTGGAPANAEAFVGELAPEVIVQIGGEPVAMGWGAIAGGARRFIIAEHGWPDGDSTAEAVLIGDVADALARIAAALPMPRLPSAYARAWREADRAAAAAMAAALAEHAASQPRLAAEHAMVGAAIAAVPDGAQLVLGNSLPVRVADEIAAGGRDLTVLTQRGAAGIDGLIAGAAGAAARGVATVLVLGDVSFAHDVGALACVRGLPVAIVVIDNGGGRIFDQLPVVSSSLPVGAFERLWRTPTTLDPVAAARAFGIDAALVRDPDEIAAAVDRGLGRASPIVIHAPVAPESAATIRKRSHV